MIQVRRMLLSCLGESPLLGISLVQICMSSTKRENATSETLAGPPMSCFGVPQSWADTGLEAKSSYLAAFYQFARTTTASQPYSDTRYLTI